MEVLGDILRGGLAKADEAGVVVLGGHTVIDEEIKFGMAVTGIVHPDRILAQRRRAARRRARAHQGARHGHRHDGAQARRRHARRRTPPRSRA